MPNPNDLERDQEEKVRSDTLNPEEEEAWDLLDQQHTARMRQSREEFERTLQDETTN